MKYKRKNSWKIIVSCLALSVFFDTAVAEKIPETSVNANNYFLRADYFSVHILQEGNRLGLVGFHLAKLFSPGFYVGGGLYSAVGGQHSGFFALGGEAGWQRLYYPMREFFIDFLTSI